MDLNQFSNDDCLIVYDWVGSLLMMGSLWGWIYYKISPLIKTRVDRSEQRCDEIKNELSVTYENYFNGLPPFTNLIKYQQKIRIYPTTSFKSYILIKFEEIRIRKRLLKYGLVTDEDTRQWEQQTDESNYIFKMLVMLKVSSIKAKFQLGIAKGIDAITKSIFSGKLSIVLFVLGFILWNLSRLLMLYK
ncbi:hypothetical protein [Desulfobacter sp. UBA2225]|uniref:hypothetical protein n=1 Tax=Desulfobacter sp. UBA2225 TaxID=1961413 RepID=UPI00257FF00B|nr:hypothetical protein [Desulfobacter sp. UBA2225]